MADNLHEKLKALRNERNWSKTEVAKRLGVKALSTYANWEYGDRTPNPKMIKEIATLYDVSINYLYGLPEDTNSGNDERDFLNAISDPELKRWYLELPKSKEEDLLKLRKMWEIIQNEDK
ncbi:helix-turn-helix transcriptional regulator [Sporosarcina soli]|uniref:Helix-turn-helix transcriptional regulator n=1 Tax=Sporosarcina soli TaxID=334736 RepID=A0ABW0TS74_9BACL